MRLEISKSSQLFHANSFSLVCRAVSIDLLQESDMDVSVKIYQLDFKVEKFQNAPAIYVPLLVNRIVAKRKGSMMKNLNQKIVIVLTTWRNGKPFP